MLPIRAVLSLESARPCLQSHRFISHIQPKDPHRPVLAGGGLMIHFGRILALGAEVTYQRITGTDFQVIEE